MNLIITGEKGFIAQNLIKIAESRGHTVIKLADRTDHSLAARKRKTREPCVHTNLVNSWVKTIKKFNVDCIIHNAATVGTDVVALDPNEATLTNVVGTHKICKAAEAAGIPVCYMGTSVIYDVDNYQEDFIYENSDLAPKTYYGQLKLAGETIVRAECSRWSIIRPLFAYGGVGDMNSLIAKTIWSSLKGKEEIDMFLDPEKIKDYMHVNDYCEAVCIALESNLWNEDYNISAENPYRTEEIVSMIKDVIDEDLVGIRWHSDTEYLGNHRLSSEKFRELTGWSPKIDLKQGISMSYDDIKSAISQKIDYNPLSYIDKAKNEGIDLHSYFPKK